MPFYSYKGVDSGGRDVSGTIEAVNEVTACEKLRRQGFFVTDLKSVSDLKKVKLGTRDRRTDPRCGEVVREPMAPPHFWIVLPQSNGTTKVQQTGYWRNLPLAWFITASILVVIFGTGSLWLYLFDAPERMLVWWVIIGAALLLIVSSWGLTFRVEYVLGKNQLEHCQWGLGYHRECSYTGPSLTLRRHELTFRDTRTGGTRTRISYGIDVPHTAGVGTVFLDRNIDTARAIGRFISYITEWPLIDDTATETEAL